MQKVTFKIEAMDNNQVIDTSEVQSVTGDVISDVLMTVVRGLLGMGFSENLIKDYMNYSSENWCVDKIGEM